MEIPNNLGKYCSLASCNELDFLPIKCEHCANIFCKNHAFPDYHQCQSISPATPSSSLVSTEKLERCALDDCNKLSMEAFISESSDTTGRLPAVCPKCKKSFCINHRHPSSHACPPPEQPDDIKNKTARALLAQHFPSRGISASSIPTISNKPKTTDPKKLAQIRKVQLMKMRHHAIPADLKDKTAAVTIDQRIHLQVTLEEDASTTKVFWFRKNMIVGRVLDCLAPHYNVSSPLQLYPADSDDRTPFRLEQSLSSQVEDGSSVVIIRPASLHNGNSTANTP